MAEAEHLSKGGELRIITDSDDDMTARCRKHLIGHDIGMRIAHGPGRDTGKQIIRSLIGQPCHLRIDKRQINMLPLTAGMTMVERGKDCG